MKLSPKQTAKQRKEVLSTRSRAYKAHEKQAGYVAVCLIMPVNPKARFLGDNRGGLPARIVVTKGKPEDAAKQEDLRDAYDEWGTRAFIHVGSDAHGERLKAALDGCLVGEQLNLGNEDRKPRRNYRDVLGSFDDDDSFMMWWGIILDAAIREVKKEARSFDVFDEDEKQEKIKRKVKRAR